MSFESAIAKTLEWEGGYSNDPADPGGVTNFGISKRWLEGVGIALDPRTLTREQAIEIYREHFWPHAEPLEKIGLVEDAEKFFDAVVNTGPVQAAKFLQRAMRAASGNDITDDGHLGPVTLNALRDEFFDGFTLTPAFRSEWAGFFRLLAATKPSQKKFLKGWLRRAYS